MEGSSKTKNRATICPCNPTPGHIPGKKHDQERIHAPQYSCSTDYNSQNMEAISTSINRGMDKEGRKTYS